MSLRPLALCLSAALLLLSGGCLGRDKSQKSDLAPDYRPGQIEIIEAPRNTPSLPTSAQFRSLEELRQMAAQKQEGEVWPIALETPAPVQVQAVPLILPANSPQREPLAEIGLQSYIQGLNRIFAASWQPLQGLDLSLESKILLQIDPNGRLQEALIIKKSGQEAFDQYALNKALEQTLLPAPPQGLEYIVLIFENRPIRDNNLG